MTEKQVAIEGQCLDDGTQIEAERTVSYKCEECDSSWNYHARGRPPTRCHICGGKLQREETTP